MQDIDFQEYVCIISFMNLLIMAVNNFLAHLLILYRDRCKISKICQVFCCCQLIIYFQLVADTVNASKVTDARVFHYNGLAHFGGPHKVSCFCYLFMYATSEWLCCQCSLISFFVYAKSGLGIVTWPIYQFFQIIC